MVYQFFREEQNPFAQIAEEKQVKLAEAVFYSVPLELTEDPIWGEDEEQEERALRQQGRPVPTLASGSRADAILNLVVVGLPDQLMGSRLDEETSPAFKSDTFDFYAFSIPTSINVGGDLIPRRIHMRLILSSTSNKAAQSRLSPVVCVFRPESDIHEKVQHFGEFKFDLWQAVRAFWPAVPDVVTASFGFSVDFKKIHPRIQASGLMSHLCEWRIADEKITYNFNPIVLVQAPKGSGLGVGAELRLGLEKSFAAGVYHKAYLKSAKPKVYRLDPKTKILHARSYMAGDEHKLWPVSKEITDEDLAKTLRKEFIFLGDHRLRADDPEAIRPPGTMSSKGVAILLLALVLMFVFAIVIGAVYG